MPEIKVGTFNKERETKNTVVYSRDLNGRKDSQYVQKSDLNQGVPTSIEVVIRYK